MANILLIETATDVCSAAIAVDGAVVALAEDLQQPNHAARLTLLIDACTRESGIPLAALDAVAVSRGPGSYTSLRVGASVAKGICYALDKPLIAVDTLQALAAASLYEVRSSKFEVRSSPECSGQTSNFKLQTSNFKLLPMLDARRQEVWLAVYDARLREILPPQPLILEHNLFVNFLETALAAQPADVFVLSGNGVKKINNDLIAENMVVSPVQHCSARLLAPLAEQFFQNSDFQEVAYFEPFYMKPPNITTPNKPLF